MRKNPKPLTICVHDDVIYNSPALQKIVEKGHRIVREGFSDDWDVEIGSKCWRIDPALGMLEKQLDMMVEGVRNIKYPKEAKNAKAPANT